MRFKCRSIQACLSEYIDCGLSDRQHAAVKNHLRHCTACRYEFESLRRTTGLLNYYVEPEPPKGYHQLFWRELQSTIEQNESQPAWALWRNVRNAGQNLFYRLVDSFQTLVGAPSRRSFKWSKIAPAYSIIFLIMSGIFLVTQFSRAPEEKRRARVDQISNPLKESPVQLVHARENRALVAKRDKALGLTQGIRNRRAPRKVNHQLEITDLSNQGLDSYGHAAFNSTSETPRGHTDDSDVFPELIASAQLTAPHPALTTREFSGAVAINSPFPEKFEREGRQSNSWLRVLKHVAVRDLSLTEVYDSVKL
ncbi:MAG: zf-HC2 domain-containing protein [Candidatus Poribacteria bacterium]|nr:zf-HC2 domain-containing protein [Candidatus Poribacteria bacterium]MDE0505113.1 zf-HC2 domain-containing protein [Candidatus Poribacteria bacterium]